MRTVVRAAATSPPRRRPGAWPAAHHHRLEPAARGELLPEQLVVLRQDRPPPRQLALLDGCLHQRDQLGREGGRLLTYRRPPSSAPGGGRRRCEGGHEDDFHLGLRGFHLRQDVEPSPPVRIRRSVITTSNSEAASARSTPVTSGATSTGVTRLGKPRFPASRAWTVVVDDQESRHASAHRHRKPASAKARRSAAPPGRSCAAHLAADGEVSAVRSHDAVHDGEPEAVPRSLVVKKRVEDALQVLVRESRAPCRVTSRTPSPACRAIRISTRPPRSVASAACPGVPGTWRSCPGSPAPRPARRRGPDLDPRSATSCRNRSTVSVTTRARREARMRARGPGEGEELPDQRSRRSASLRTTFHQAPPPARPAPEKRRGPRWSRTSRREGCGSRARGRPPSRRPREPVGSAHAPPIWAKAR